MPMKNLLFTLLSLFAFAQLASATQEPDHSIWDRYLGNHVSETGVVNYQSMKVNMDSLDTYLLELRNHQPDGEWTTNQRLAYYINAYNAYTVKFILGKYPVESVKDISFSGKDLWSFRMANLGGTNYTLKQIEDDMLRKLGDPRIHFAINCGAKSCPKLMNSAYSADDLNTQLTEAAKTFINDSKRNIIGEKKLQLSELFSWYSGDFTSTGKSLIEYLNQYSSITISPNAKIEYLTYDWALND